jgi:hypothetical protein
VTKKVVGVFVRFRAPSGNMNLKSLKDPANVSTGGKSESQFASHSTLKAEAVSAFAKSKSNDEDILPYLQSERRVVSNCQNNQVLSCGRKQEVGKSNSVTAFLKRYV